jgi:hypothetical protein
MPILRRQIHGFVRTWNVHKIRRQKGREYLPTGQPLQLFHRPQQGIDDYRTRVDLNTLQNLKRPLLSYGKTPL